MRRDLQRTISVRRRSREATAERRMVGKWSDCLREMRLVVKDAVDMGAPARAERGKRDTAPSNENFFSWLKSSAVLVYF